MTSDKPGDLADCYDQLDWATRQIDLVEHELNLFMRSNPYLIVRERYDDIFDAYYLEMTAEPPGTFKALIATCIQSMRSSLDYLAVSLAKRNGATSTRDVYFPFACSEEEFSKKHILERIKRLGVADQKVIIEDIRPYLGGNDLLYAIHWLNIESKHIQLNIIGTAANLAAILPPVKGNGHIANLTTGTCTASPESRALIAVVNKASDVDLSFVLNVTFHEIAGIQPAIPLIPFLREACKMCWEIVQFFATPAAAASKESNGSAG